MQDIISINDLVSWSVNKRLAIDAMEMLELDDRLAARTGLQSGESWLVVRGCGHEEGAEAPACWAEYYIHGKFAAVGRLLHRHRGPVFPLIEDVFGVKVVQVQQNIGAKLIDAALASTLKVEVGSAALEVQRTYQLSGGQTAQVTVSTHPADRYHHSTTLRRMSQVRGQ